MQNTALKMLAFDVFGVLISEGHLISNGLLRLLPDTTNQSLVKYQYDKFNIGEINEDEFWENIGQAGNDALRSEFLNLFQLDPDFAVIQQLKHNYRFAILSNFPSYWARFMWDKFDFNDQFEPVIFSGFVECKKPNPDIYKILIKKSGLAEDQIAFIDDRLENLQTAHKLGMTTIYFERESDSHSYQPRYNDTKLTRYQNNFYKLIVYFVKVLHLAWKSDYFEMLIIFLSLIYPKSRDSDL